MSLGVPSNWGSPLADAGSNRLSARETPASSWTAYPPQLSLIIPTYKEAENLPRLVERVHWALDGCRFEIIVVDDDSPDGTAKVANELSRDSPLNLVVRTGERGLASAVLTGFGLAAGRVLGVMDADLQHPPEHLRPMLAAIDKGADLVVASRYSPGGADLGSVVRKNMSRAATLLTRALLSSARATPDPLSGFFLLRREVVDGAELNPVGYKILLEVLVRGRARRVTSIPYEFQRRLKGISKFNLSEQGRSLGHILGLARVEARQWRPFRRAGRTENG